MIKTCAVNLVFASLLGCALHAQDAEPKEPFILEVGEHSLIDLIKSSGEYLDRLYLYSPQELENPSKSRVTIDRRMELDARACEEVIGQILYTNGIARVTRDKERGIYEWISMYGPKRQELTSSSEYVPVDRVGEYRNLWGVTILTAVPLRHINANTAQTQLRPFFAQGGAGGVGLTPGSVGNGRSLLLQGFGPQVAQAVELLQKSDAAAAEPLSQEGKTIRERLSRLEEQVQQLKQALEKR
ncbi:MAG: hypothetical protein ACYTG5_18990 [Planctomycetota bacterium]|jgi:hypothetical protein